LMRTRGLSGNHMIAKLEFGMTIVRDFSLGQDAHIHTHELHGSKRIFQSAIPTRLDVERTELNAQVFSLTPCGLMQNMINKGSQHGRRCPAQRKMKVKVCLFSRLRDERDV